MSKESEESIDSIMTLMQRVRAGDSDARDRLFRLVYPDLKRLAQGLLAQRGRAPNAPSATTLVQDACRRLLERDALDVESRRHLFRLFCRAMEDEWVERARYDLAQKRRAPGAREPLADLADDQPANGIEFPELRRALQELAVHDAEAAEVVALRFYCGASLQETAEITSSTLAIVRRNWSYAKAWLHDRLSRDDSDAGKGEVGRQA